MGKRRKWLEFKDLEDLDLKKEGWFYFDEKPRSVEKVGKTIIKGGK